MKRFLLLLTVIVTAASCQKYDVFEFGEQHAWGGGTITLPDTLISPSVPIIMPNQDTGIVLGDKLENPYSVANMRAAYDVLRPTLFEAGIDEDDITTTHFYVRFQPDNEEELQLIKQRYGNYDIYEYPLDYELSGRISYHDPSLPDTVPTYQYMSIDSLSWNTISRPENIDFEVLERLFIPDEDLDIETFSRKLSAGTTSYEDAIEALITTSLEMTDNLEDEEIDGDNTMASNVKWYPSGRITAYDDVVGGQVPLKGVKVRVRRWFTTYTATTDANGNFACDKSFKRPANYSIVWDGPKWNIRDGQVVQAYYNGPKQKGAWNLDIPNDNNKSLRYAAIHRAVHRFKEGNTYGLTRINNTFCTNICYRHKSNPDAYGDYNREWGMYICSDIRVFGKKKNIDDTDEYRKIHEVIATTFHELGHAAHYTNNISRYSSSSKKLLESWASFVGYYLTLKEYQELGFPDGPFNVLRKTIFDGYTIRIGLEPDGIINRQLNEVVDGNDYLPIFIDMHDNNNQSIVNVEYGHTSQYYPDDKIHSIPADVIEGFVFSSNELDEAIKKLTPFYNNNDAENNAQYDLTFPNLLKLYSLYFDTTPTLNP